MHSDKRQLPIHCPSCGSGLQVQSLSCPDCDTEVKGRYALPVLLRLEEDELDFILSFVKSSGSLKQMAKEMGLSYPTVRNYLNDLIEKLNKLNETD